MAKKKLGFIGEILLSTLLPKILEMGSVWLKEKLNEAYKDNPTLVTAGVVGVYPFIDVYLEKAVQESNNKHDDKPVEEIMEVLEEFAREKGFTLPNLDND